ncbi:MAG: ribbon-helix-helix domain-containing protein [Bryobacteraceae bacterium]
MTIDLNPEQEALVQERLRSGAFTSPEEVIERALEFLRAEEDWLVENRDEIAAKIQEGWDEAQRGELLDPEDVRAKVQEHKRDWLKRHRTA